MTFAKPIIMLIAMAMLLNVAIAQNPDDIWRQRRDQEIQMRNQEIQQNRQQLDWYIQQGDRRINDINQEISRVQGTQIDQKATPAEQAATRQKIDATVAYLEASKQHVMRDQQLLRNQMDYNMNFNNQGPYNMYRFVPQTFYNAHPYHVHYPQGPVIVQAPRPVYYHPQVYDPQPTYAPHGIRVNQQALSQENLNYQRNQQFVSNIQY
ncbi:hypothetical protein SAMD00019534_000890 [Acytostelium subglobosum LB1]|uniref:hypothetical protein n=1 Tax=Acytostelium subglobosum LB1 TaxID=1410327 RepID=UPI0006447B9C|nr:hypothetical protein SAMD00019534_000890 [Acytostelium subglobosum LB1]GAM16914.1 hypothetical protein SAMD00019534_000890 [Acytostelium subglobosum LB1]|eukprot:XP_012758976.1 hypothetical protein SAMD00019534_000890 [Acytostelium subglobosum LB1]